jgi:resuscitation-promoting factor RpfB
LVSLYADGQKRVFATSATTVRQVLAESGVKLGASDLVEPGLTAAVPQGFFNINVYRSRPVLVQDGFQTYRLESAFQSPRLLAQAAGLSVYPEDTYTTEIIDDIVGDQAVGVKVTVKRSVPLTVRADGKLRSIRTQAATVGEALAGAGIAMGLKDTASVPLDQPVVRGMQVTVTRVAEVEASITTVLPRPVQTVTDPNMMKGQTKIQAEGSDGQKTAVYRIHYRDGVETGREMIQLVSQTAPVTRVEVVGTKVLFAGSVEYWRPLVIQAAAEWNIDPNMMLRIMACESGGNATSISRFTVNGEHPMGLFQYLPSTWRAAGGTDANILDGTVQIKLTAKKMALYGTKPWQCQ